LKTFLFATYCGDALYKLMIDFDIDIEWRQTNVNGQELGRVSR